jgi:hypothetical protein
MYQGNYPASLYVFIKHQANGTARLINWLVIEGRFPLWYHRNILDFLSCKSYPDLRVTYVYLCITRTRKRGISIEIWGISIEILDLECVLGHVTGVQIENKNSLINPPCWIWAGVQTTKYKTKLKLSFHSQNVLSCCLICSLGIDFEISSYLI